MAIKVDTKEKATCVRGLYLSHFKISEFPTKIALPFSHFPVKRVKHVSSLQFLSDVGAQVSG